MMNLTCIGSLYWWKEFLGSNEYQLYVHHTFQKQCSLSQYHIMGPNGLIKHSIPLVKETRKGPYVAVEISYAENWQMEHWKSIETAYRKAPFFIYYNYIIEPIFKAKYNTLLEFNIALLRQILQCLKMESTLKLNKVDPVNYAEVQVKPINAYPQVFDERHDFNPNVFILDAVFNLGPEVKDYLIEASSSS